jgi:hypothetical protein
MPIDPVVEASNLAQRYFELSQAVDNFRLSNFGEITTGRQAQLKKEAQAFDERGKEATAAALGAILQNIQPHLPTIQQATKDARDALNTLNNVAKGLAIVDAALALVGSIAIGNAASVPSDVQTLLQAIGA